MAEDYDEKINKELEKVLDNQREELDKVRAEIDKLKADLGVDGMGDDESLTNKMKKSLSKMQWDVF